MKNKFNIKKAEVKFVVDENIVYLVDQISGEKKYLGVIK